VRDLLFCALLKTVLWTWLIFRRVRNIAKSNCYFRYVCPSIRRSTWNDSAPTGWILREMFYLANFGKSVQKIKVSLKSYKNYGYLNWRPAFIFNHISLIVLRMRNFADKFAEKIQTHIFRISYRLWGSVEKYSIYRVSQEEWTKLRESVPYVKLYRYNPKHLYPKLNGYGDNGHRKIWASGVSTYCKPSVTPYSFTEHARQRETTS